MQITAAKHTLRAQHIPRRRVAHLFVVVARWEVLRLHPAQYHVPPQCSRSVRRKSACQLALRRRRRRPRQIGLDCGYLHIIRCHINWVCVVAFKRARAVLIIKQKRYPFVWPKVRMWTIKSSTFRGQGSVILVGGFNIKVNKPGIIIMHNKPNNYTKNQTHSHSVGMSRAPDLHSKTKTSVTHIWRRMAV